MIVVSDTSLLNYLVLIQHEHILPALFGRVLVPHAVVIELSHSGAPVAVRTWISSPPAWLEVCRPTQLLTAGGLGAGEMEALSLAKELDADAVLIDVRRGFITAQQLGLFATGTIGVLAIAAEKKLISLPSAFAALRRTTFRASDDLLDAALDRDKWRRGTE